VLQFEIRGLSARVIRNYLATETDTTAVDEHRVRGPGWCATLTDLPPDEVGRFRVRALQVSFEGQGAEPVAQRFRLWSMRGGG
jgi:hypothetical protein